MNRRAQRVPDSPDPSDSIAPPSYLEAAPPPPSYSEAMEQTPDSSDNAADIELIDTAAPDDGSDTARLVVWNCFLIPCYGSLVFSREITQGFCSLTPTPPSLKQTMLKCALCSLELYAFHIWIDILLWSYHEINRFLFFYTQRSPLYLVCCWLLIVQKYPSGSERTVKLNWLGVPSHPTLLVPPYYCLSRLTRPPPTYHQLVPAQPPYYSTPASVRSPPCYYPAASACPPVHLLPGLAYPTLLPDSNAPATVSVKPQNATAYSYAEDSYNFQRTVGRSDNHSIKSSQH